jgi:hypothetical protein
MNKQVIELGFLSDRFLKRGMIDFSLTPIIKIKKLTAIALLLTMNQPLLAKPLEGFCLSQTDPSKIDYEKKLHSIDGSQLPFTVNDKNYFLDYGGGSSISLYQVDNGKNVRLQTVTASQSSLATFLDPDIPGIRRVRLADNGLVLIDGPYIDYVAWIDFNEPLFKINTDGWVWIGEVINPIVTFFDKPPSISTPVRLADLSSIECRIPVINWFIDYCDKTKFKYYSSNLKRAFFSAPHFFGLISKTEFELIGDEVRALPNDIAENIDLEFGYHDVSVSNSVLVKGTQNEMLLYDGKQLTPVPFDSSLYGDKFSWNILLYSNSHYSNFEPAKDKNERYEPWIMESDGSKQTFLEIISDTKQKKFLVKLRADGVLVPVLAGSFSDQKNNGDYLNDISFYDGKQFTPLLENIADENEFYWSIRKSPISKRLFLFVHARRKQQMFFMELGNNGSLKKTILTQDFYPVLFEMPQPLTLFLLTESDLNIEINDVFRPVVSVKQPFSLRPYHSSYSGKPPYDALGFEVEKYSKIFNAKNFRNYFIVRTSPQANCIAPLDPDKPIVLNTDD